MNMKIELKNSEKALTLKDFEEVESKLGHAVPERLKEFYLKWNGGKPKQQTICINRYYEVEIMSFMALNTTEETNLAQRSTDSNYKNVLIFAISWMGERIAVNIKDGAVYGYPVVGFTKINCAFVFGEPRLIADTANDFFDNLVVKPEMEEIQTEADGVMPELSDYSASLTKEDIKDFETELNVKIPASMKKFYLKFNGGMPSPYCYQPQDEDMDWVEINAFFPIKERTNAFETIEVIAKDIWSRNLMPCNLLPFAMDSGGNYYTLNLKNKKIYYYLTDEWNENASREYNFETNTRYIAQSFNYFINHFIEEEE